MNLVKKEIDFARLVFLKNLLELCKEDAFLKVFAIRFIVQIHVKVRRARINLFDDAILNLFKKCRFPATPNASNNLNDILCDKRDDF